MLSADEPVRDEVQRVEPMVWRLVLEQVVEAVRHGDPTRASEVSAVEPVSPEVAAQMVEYIADYGETLVPPPLETTVGYGAHFPVTDLGSVVAAEVLPQVASL